MREPERHGLAAKLLFKAVPFVRRRQRLGHIACNTSREPDECRENQCRGLQMPTHQAIHTVGSREWRSDTAVAELPKMYTSQPPSQDEKQT